MIQILVILAFVSLHTSDLVGERGTLIDVSHGTASAMMLCSLALLWLIGQGICVRAGRMLDATGEVAAAIAAERGVSLLRILGGVQFAGTSSAIGWFGVVTATVSRLPALGELVAVAPLLLYFAGQWWSIAPLERRLREARVLRQLREGEAVHRPPTRWEYVWANVRHQVMLVLIPVLMLNAWRDVLKMWGDRLPFISRLSGEAAGWAHLGYDLAGVAIVFIVTPALIQLVWDTVPITSGPFYDTLRDMCRRYRVRMRTPLLWRTHGSMVNGAVLGLVWPFRYLMFTDALFDRLTARQVEGVAAHEVGHIKRRHILWLGISVFAALSVGELLGVPVAWIVRANEGTTEGIVVGSMIACVAFVFGWVSRRFEWQADAFAVQHLSRTGALASQEKAACVSSEAVESMTSALLHVAVVNGMNPNTFTVRHGSIRTRVERLRALEGLTLDAIPIDRQVRIIQWAAGIVFVLGIVAATVMEMRGASA